MDQPHTSSPPGLRWGIIGVGTIAERFAADVALSGGSSVQAVFSRRKEKAEAFARRFGGTAHSNAVALLEREDVDAVYIATPNDAHFASAKAAILTGKAVLLEKPITVTSAEAEELAALARTQGVFLMEAMWTRFLPAVTFLRQAIRDGRIGTIRRVKGELAFQKSYSPDDRFFNPALGGGSLLDLGVYPISLCLDLFGEPDAISGSWRAAPSGVDHAAVISLRFGETKAQLSSGFDRTGDNLFVVEGTKGTLILQPPFNAARMVVEGSAGLPLSIATMAGGGFVPRLARKLSRTLPLPGLTRHDFSYPGNGLQFEISAMAQAIADGLTEHPMARLKDSIAALRIIEQVRSQPALS